MANICEFEMKIVGSFENMQKFYEALIQKDDIWIGRGAGDTNIRYDENKQSAIIDGWVSWTIENALVIAANDMKKEKEIQCLTLWEACKLYDVVMEVYSKEDGTQFQQHILCNKGNVEIDDTVNWYEYVDEQFEVYETKEEMEKELEITLSEQEWQDKYATGGGFKSWNFQI
ncbi:hypothetical protein [Faecalibacillus faecis]|uniref:hypothetical protein n=1 Tax=Faecalibacillus faecis TaxID=1982628 RepID=UPI003AB27394